MDKQTVVNAYNGILLSAKRRNEVFMKPQKKWRNINVCVCVYT